MLSKFDKILLDVSGTLYSNKKVPLEGSKIFLENFYDKIIIFSNIGSKTGLELQKDLSAIFKVPIPKTITSLDILIHFLKKKSYKSVFHFGSKKVEKKIQPFIKKIVSNYSDNIDAVIFTSLIDEGWIHKAEVALNIILKNDSDILLGNPDRISPEPPFHFTTTLILDGLLNLSNILGKRKAAIEFGKPDLTKKILDIKVDEKLVVIGDNPWTDIQQSINMNCDSILISSKSNLSRNQPTPTFIVSSLNKLL
tara:strand:+ start:2534 stop:3289 length:756 start_codon:yes stop_codon:yes gene_type:complete